MLRRRPASDRRPGGGPATDPAGVVEVDDGPGLVDELRDAGWVLPRGLGTERPSWTLVGTVASPTATPVDPAGLVGGEGWSVDWWIGADDRWHLPSRSAAVRQHVLDDAPVVETALRIPGGDAVHRAYGIRSPRPVGDEWVIAEVENRTPVPVAVAIVLRPFVPGGLGEASAISLAPVGGGRGRDVAHAVLVDGRVAVVLPRRPARLAVGSRAAGDVVGPVLGGGAGTDLVEASCPDGLATLAAIFPLPHTALLRVAVPVGRVGPQPPDLPAVVPDAAAVASGWEVHGRGPRIEVPDRRLGEALARSRRSLVLSHDGAAVRRDGHRAPDLEPGATEVLLGAFDALDRPADVGTVIARWTDRLADPDPEVDALFLRTVSRHWLLHRIDALLDWMLPEVAAGVERLDRAHRKGRLDTAAARRRATAALAATATMLDRAGQPEASARVARLAAKVGADLEPPEPTTPAEHLLAVAADLASGDRARAVAAAERLAVEVADASPTGAWPGPGRAGRPLGHDLAASAALVLAVRALLVDDGPAGIDLLPVHPDGWYGGGVEVHDLPTEHGRLSFAVRWHGTRPALLWDLDPHDDAPVRLGVPGLDPAWSTTERRGDALLAPVAPPDGLDPLALVVEHPDIAPEMRRPGQASEAADGEVDPPVEDWPEWDGGSFS